MNRAEEFLESHPEVAAILGEIPKEGVIAVILFGSHATKKAGPLSDIDLCIVGDRALTEHQKNELLSFGSRIIELSLFWDLPLTIRFRIIRDGIILYCKNPELLHRITVNIVRKYLDIEPLIRKHSLAVIRTRG
ncbi:MAG: Nucleotidyltransferase domain protein [Methanoregulaceae archaeon PtaU1.Bin059]|nr:MAG: Nucleotidyltransferase domain protein [Methanoregulaceae archaeon PtaU1.Bin059]